MSVESLANTVATAIKAVRDNKGKAEYGVYSGGMVTVESGTYSAVKAVPINLYDGKQVWVQLSADGVAVIIGE